MPNGFIPGETANAGLYVPTTNVWEIARLQDVDINSEEFRLLLVRLYQNINAITLALNLKESAYYLTTPFVTGKVYYSATATDANATRGSHRLVVDTGALGPGVTTVAHGLPVSTSWQATLIYGAATDSATPQFYPIPWAGAAGYLSVVIDATNVVIDNTTGVTFDKSLVVFEYLVN